MFVRKRDISFLFATCRLPGLHRTIKFQDSILYVKRAMARSGYCKQQMTDILIKCGYSLLFTIYCLDKLRLCMTF